MYMKFKLWDLFLIKYSDDTLVSGLDGYLNRILRRMMLPCKFSIFSPSVDELSMGGVCKEQEPFLKRKYNQTGL